MTSDLEALVAAGVDPAEAAAALAAADQLAERTAQRTAGLLAEQLAAGMIAGKLGAAIGPVLNDCPDGWTSFSPLYLPAGHQGEVRAIARQDRIELELSVDGRQVVWTGVLRR